MQFELEARIFTVEVGYEGIGFNGMSIITAGMAGIGATDSVGYTSSQATSGGIFSLPALYHVFSG